MRLSIIGTSNAAGKTLYRLHVQMADGRSHSILKSVAEFRAMHAKLKSERSASAQPLPWFPLLNPFTTNALSRMEALNNYLAILLIVDQYATSPALQAFVQALPRTGTTSGDSDNVNDIAAGLTIETADEKALWDLAQRSREMIPSVAKQFPKLR